MNEGLTPNSPTAENIVFAAQGLLQHSRELVCHQREMEEATGERFNLFRILGIEHYEVSTHSPLLGDLLDPRGSHGQGSVFLKHFLEALEIKEPVDIESTRLRREVWCGACTETNGGRLDILITADHGGWQVAIENKIHAGEQENWVRRYRNELEKLGVVTSLIYLTLDGKPPEKIDGGMAHQVRPISYEKDILKWLESCRKEAATVPIVRESLTQYIHLIQKLTHQNRSSRMDEEIIKSVLSDKGNFQAFLALRNAEGNIKGRIVKNLGERIEKLMRELPEPGFKILKIPQGDGNKGEGFYFTTPELAARNLQAVIAFDAVSYENCWFGFKVMDDKPITKDAPVRQMLCEEFKKHFGHCNSTSDWDIAYDWWTQHRNWDDDLFERIQFWGQEFDKEIIRLARDLLEVATSFSKKASQPT